MDRRARPDDGSPARLIAIMVGIVGILLLGSLAWSAVGAMFSALGEVTTTFSPGRPTPTKLSSVGGTPTSVGANSANRQAPGQATPGPGTPNAAAARTATPGAGTPEAATAGTPTLGAPRAAGTPVLAETPAVGVTPTPAVGPTPAPTATPSASGRAPWLLLPQPAPDSRVPPGQLVIEARGRGETPIAAIRLELDGVPLPVSLEQRSESTWRGSASTNVGSGHHAVRATVIDEGGRTGGFRWSFDAGP